MHFVDRLYEVLEAKGAAPVCVGIDPVFERLPAGLREGRSEVPADRMDAIFEYVMELLEVVADAVGCVKLQSACFERYGPDGVQAYYSLAEAAASAGLVVIGDAKRGDIGTSAAHYAAATLVDPVDMTEQASEEEDGDDLAAPDAVTVNAYFGEDGIRPFLDVAEPAGKGVFALVRTSNPGGDAIQSLKLEDGRSVAEAVGTVVAGLGDEPAYIGESGYSLLGAVVGATKAADAARLRRIMPRQLFLVPGFGAQGGGADDVAACFDETGRGAIVTASRSIIYAYEEQPHGDWRDAVAGATRQMSRQIAAIAAG